MNSLARTSMPENTALTVPVPAVQLGTLSATTGAGLLEAAASLATPLKAPIDSRHLSNVISGRPYVKCEGWTAMAAMLGITPHEVSVTEQDGIYTAVVELRRINDGQSIARSSAECGAPDQLDRKGQPLWASRPRYARRSMALTRATAKACRLAFSWVIVLAGYEATPAEEMPYHGTIDVTPTKPSAPTENGSAHTDAETSDLFSDKQRSRLYAIAKEAGWKDAEMKAELKKRFGYEHSKDIPWRRYTRLEELTQSWAAAIEFIEETDAQLAQAIREGQVDSVRYAALPERASLEVLQAGNTANGCVVSTRASAEGRLELLWYVREQSISTDYHRYGNLGLRADEARAEVI